MAKADRFERRAAERRRVDELLRLDAKGSLVIKSEVHAWLLSHGHDTVAVGFAEAFRYDPGDSARKAVGGGSS